MPIYTIGPRKEFTALPTGEYVMTLRSVEQEVEEKDSQYSKRGDVKVVWTWDVAVPNGESQQRKSRTAPPETWSKKSNFVHICTALGLVDDQRASEEGIQLDPATGVGLKCIGVIVQKLKEGSTFEFTDTITAFKPLPVPVFGQGVVPAPAASAPISDLLARAQKLLWFAGSNELVANGTPVATAQQIRRVGAQPMSPQASQALATAARNLCDLGGTSYIEQVGKQANLKEGLLLLDAIEKEQAELDAVPF